MGQVEQGLVEVEWTFLPPLGSGPLVGPRRRVDVHVVPSDERLRTRRVDVHGRVFACGVHVGSGRYRAGAGEAYGFKMERAEGASRPSFYAQGTGGERG